VETIVHGTCVALGGSCAILRGAPGAGKSDLALRFLYLPLASGAGSPALVADDRTILRRAGGAVIASCPEALKGRIEMRGLGLARAPATVAEARLALLVDLDDPESAAIRFPESWRYEDVLGMRIPRIALEPFEASAPVKLALALQNMLEDPSIN
jgi:HPr kinase/phosphorylase